MAGQDLQNLFSSRASAHRDTDQRSARTLLVSARVSGALSGTAGDVGANESGGIPRSQLDAVFFRDRRIVSRKEIGQKDEVRSAKDEVKIDRRSYARLLVGHSTGEQPPEQCKQDQNGRKN